MSNYFSNINIIKLIAKWRLHLLIISIATVILATVFSSSIFIKPKYKSTAVVYPTNLAPYSSETPTEQLLQLFMSDEVRNNIIAKFELAKHYNVDTTKRHYKTTLIKKYADNVSIKKNEHDAIVLDVLDTDPLTACKINESIIDFLNLKVRAIQREKIQEVVYSLEKKLNDKKNQIDSLEQRLDTLRIKYGILDYTLQTKAFTKEYLKTVQNKGGGNNYMSGFLNNLQYKGGEFLLLGGYLSSAAGTYSEIKVEYEKALNDLNKKLTYTSVVSKPLPADKKSYPIRWFIVSISLIASLILSIIIIIFIENYYIGKSI